MVIKSSKQVSLGKWVSQGGDPTKLTLGGKTNLMEIDDPLLQAVDF